MAGAGELGVWLVEGGELGTGVVLVAEFTKEEFPKLKVDSVRDHGFKSDTDLD